MSRKSSDTKTKILQATWQMLESGSDVRVADIAKAAGISRQALYLHYPTRAELLIATTRYIDEAKEVDKRLAPSRSAKSGLERLDAYIEAWGNYIPEIRGVGRALMAMQDQDEAARVAWADRMNALREGFEAAVAALDRDGDLSPDLTPQIATDLLCALMSVHGWKHLRLDCGWDQAHYVKEMQRAARKLVTRAG